ncbi:hypothetical protein BAE44_0006216 [Dichanthelium oligosanthes]|uniref:DUF569 domain-containing protein n=1 Tax=Dichanthelium oligosanthes TaxID=888268 RepID=A0A1E5W5V7_9POAL|nr:hypothetical protein BAE44_0006216 [Dichanthelium oligosanthes]
MELFPDLLYTSLSQQPPREPPPSPPSTFAPAAGAPAMELFPDRAHVHRVQRGGNDYVLLHSAAYGRYLAVSPQPLPLCHRTVQTNYDDADQDHRRHSASAHQGERGGR